MKSGSVREIIWWMSMKSPVNFIVSHGYGEYLGNSLLHVAAIENKPNIFGFLLLVIILLL